MNNIIAVSGPVGGGKTSFVKALAGRLYSAPVIHYDHYETETLKSPEYLKKWIKDGADFNEFTAPGLSEDLRKLKTGESITDVSTGKKIGPQKYILFEMPLGKEHKETANLIDILIWIDIPLDSALARKMREFTEIFLGRKGDYRESILWLKHYLENYLDVIRDVLVVQKERVSVNADIVVDGMGNFESMVEYAAGEIEKKCSV